MCAVLTSNLVVCVFEPIGQPGLDWTMVSAFWGRKRGDGCVLMLRG